MTKKTMLSLFSILVLTLGDGAADRGGPADEHRSAAGGDRRVRAAASRHRLVAGDLLDELLALQLGRRLSLG